MTQSTPDSVAGGLATAYDSLWTPGPAAQNSGLLESVMLSNDKLYVVLTVVLIIWLGLVFFVLRTDKKLSSLERSIEEGIGPEERDADGVA